MIDLEIPMGKRTKKYRFFEMVPALLSFGALALLVVLSLVDPLLAAIYLLLVIVTTLVKALGIAFHTIRGYKNLEKSQSLDWHGRLEQLETPKKSYDKRKNTASDEFAYKEHLENLRTAEAFHVAFSKIVESGCRVENEGTGDDRGDVDRQVHRHGGGHAARRRGRDDGSSRNRLFAGPGRQKHHQPYSHDDDRAECQQ